MADTFAVLPPVDPAKRSHAKRVRAGVWIDQHGREHAGQEDKNTGHPVGALLPEGWAPPHPDLYPSSAYLTYPERRNGRVTVLYEKWQSENANAWRDWRNARSKFALSLWKNKAAEAIKEDDASVMELVGPTPMAEEFIVAMSRGNRWALGLMHPETGMPYPTPQWAKGALWATLQRQETFAGGGATTTFAGDLFADEDEAMPAPSMAATSARLDAAAQYAPFDDEALPTTPVAARSHKRKPDTL
jgi:hypothetical protein